MSEDTEILREIRDLLRLIAEPALANLCVSMGLMELNSDKKRVRLFDLLDFGLIDAVASAKSEKKRER